MNADYVNGVRRFGSGGRLKDENGETFNISHRSDCRPAEVETDGSGNVTKSPLIYRKGCFGRVERFARNHTRNGIWHDENGESHLSDTSCDTCLKLSPGVYEACARVVHERVVSNPAIEVSFDAWLTDCGNDFGPRCFARTRGKLWEAFLQAIIDHGGWSNCNDDQVRIEIIRLQRGKKDQRNATARANRIRKRLGRRSTPGTFTPEYLRALQAERDLRADRMKGWTRLSGRSPRDMLWLKNLPETTCDRTADVWQTRKLLSRDGHKVTGKEIAECLIRDGRDYGLGLRSLTARVYEDIKRVDKFEDNGKGHALWPMWVEP